jgi:hypothetical protein
VWDETFEALRAQPRGEQVEPRALGFGEQRARNVETQGVARYRSVTEHGCEQAELGTPALIEALRMTRESRRGCA